MESTETYDAIFCLNVDVQNEFMPGGKRAVTARNEIVNPLNVVNGWTREHNGTVVFTRDFIDHKAGAAFPDELQINPRDTLAYDHPKDGLYGRIYDETKRSGYFAGLDANSPLYRRSNGRTRGIEAVNEAITDATQIYEGHRVQRQRVAILVGGIATETRVLQTVLDAAEQAKAIHRHMQQQYEMPHRDYRGQELRYPEPLERPLGVFVLRDAVRANEPAAQEDTFRAMSDMGAQIVTTEDIIHGTVLPLRS